MYRFKNIITKISFIILAYLIFDIVFFSLLPNDIKTKIYNNRAHRIKSFYYHHDFRPNASFVDQWGYNKTIINTNNLGFKDSEIRDVTFKKKNILFIGDSFTEGVGLMYEDTFVWIIEKKLKSENSDIEILNAGVQSYSPKIYYTKLYDILERKKYPINFFTKPLDKYGHKFMIDTLKMGGVDGLDLTVRPKGSVLPERVEKDLPLVVEMAKSSGLLLEMMVILAPLFASNLEHALPMPLDPPQTTARKPLNSTFMI